MRTFYPDTKGYIFKSALILIVIIPFFASCGKEQIQFLSQT